MMYYYLNTGNSGMMCITPKKPSTISIKQGFLPSYNDTWLPSTLNYSTKPPSYNLYKFKLTHALVYPCGVGGTWRYNIFCVHLH